MAPPQSCVVAALPREELESLPDELLVELEDSAVAGVRVDHQLVDHGDELPTLDGATRAVAVRQGDEVLGALAIQKPRNDLRDLARGIYPPLLADKGLVVALEAQAR